MTWWSFGKIVNYWTVSQYFTTYTRYDNTNDTLSIRNQLAKIGQGQPQVWELKKKIKI